MAGRVDDQANMAELLSRNAEVVATALGAAKPHAAKPHAAKPHAAKPHAAKPHAAKPHAAKISPMSALLAARTVAELAEDATRILVDRARAAGHTWTEIGELLRSSRQAAQQRFGSPAREPRDEFADLATRASTLIERLRSRRWTAATAGWTEQLRAELPPQELAKVWDRLQRSTGQLVTAGRASVVRKGPFRIADVPLAFEHGPMRARITFDHDEQVAGLFFLLPDTGENT
jgi:hypothetical protein